MMSKYILILLLLMVGCSKEENNPAGVPEIKKINLDSTYSYIPLLQVDEIKTGDIEHGTVISGSMVKSYWSDGCFVLDGSRIEITGSPMSIKTENDYGLIIDGERAATQEWVLKKISEMDSLREEIKYLKAELSRR
jgi:PBP1b-binding outer membrane lipoprotein LpoB